MKGPTEKPLPLIEISISIRSLRKLTTEKRSSILILGHLLNEANWLRKLLAQAVVDADDGPQGQASLALAFTLASILASKMFEGGKAMNSRILGPLLRELEMPKKLDELRRDTIKRLNEGTLSDIRNKFGFHYPDHFDIPTLSDFDESHSTVFNSLDGSGINFFSHISSLSALETLLKCSKEGEIGAKLHDLWKVITEITGQYCHVVSEIFALALQSWLSNGFFIRSRMVLMAPEHDEMKISFFTQLPDHLTKLKQN